jgi:tRNA dimethylallyltransferase
MEPKPTKPLVVIVGETASGKSALALELAKRFNGEIICADSWTVRREVNIGTAKPSAQQQKQIPHHLLDIVGPDEDFTAAVFKQLANKAIADITSRGKLPIMVGGTGLYIDGVIFDYGFLPEGDREKRKTWNNLSPEELRSAANARGLSLEGIDIQNKRRLIRLLETNGAQPTKHALRPNTLILGLKIPKEELESRIEQRVGAMFEAGLENEVKNLAEKYGWECEGLKGIGYREWKEHYAGTQTLEETRAKIIKSTRDLAKRQRTWFKRNSFIQWLDDKGKVVEIVTTFLNKAQ